MLFIYIDVEIVKLHPRNIKRKRNKQANFDVQEDSHFKFSSDDDGDADLAFGKEIKPKQPAKVYA